MAKDKETNKKGKKGSREKKSESGGHCCYVVDTCGCCVDPCGCYVDPCCC
ncbi:MAG: hypothetical protein H6Q48_2299 [Deltaproteobacteria bacterium]|jgi:hypothetical protein|nr:hypothetical protein [Deltaproteobacteria bacterium]